MNDLVSIITPSYNSAKFIGETINSVLSQTYHNWEMIIVDDCSNDNTVDIIREYIWKDSRIKLIENKVNVGAAETRNEALRVANGRFIAFLDSDDLWLPRKLEDQIEFMHNNDIAFSFTDYEVIKENGMSTNKIIKVPRKINYNQYLSNTIIGCLTVVIDKDKVDYFEMPNIKSSHDMALWLLIMKKGFKAYGLQKCLSKYRLVSTSNTAKKWKAAKDVWRVYRNIEKLSLLRSMISFSGYAFNAIRKRL